jgi:hypothetical protein
VGERKRERDGWAVITRRRNHSFITRSGRLCRHPSSSSLVPWLGRHHSYERISPGLRLCGVCARGGGRVGRSVRARSKHALPGTRSQARGIRRTAVHVPVASPSQRRACAPAHAHGGRRTADAVPGEREPSRRASRRRGHSRKIYGIRGASESVSFDSPDSNREVGRASRRRAITGDERVRHAISSGRAGDISPPRPITSPPRPHHDTSTSRHAFLTSLATNAVLAGTFPSCPRHVPGNAHGTRRIYLVRGVSLARYMKRASDLRQTSPRHHPSRPAAAAAATAAAAGPRACTRRSGSRHPRVMKSGMARHRDRPGRRCWRSARGRHPHAGGIWQLFGGEAGVGWHRRGILTRWGIGCG